MRLFLLGLLFLMCQRAEAQSSRIIKFDVQRIGVNSVFLNWTMDAGSTCLDLSIQRSNNGSDFETIYTYPGVCGSINEAVNYNWIDQYPKKFELNYYRIKLEEGEFTLVKMVDIDSDLAGDSFILNPNPASSVFSIKLINSEFNTVKIELFNLQGKLQKAFLFPKQDQMKMDIKELPKGIYLLKVGFENGQVLGVRRLMVL
ncbi:MAG: T9SS type A sorting domain-containing protein [Flavobacteriales bacterium]|nr:T9SS type A sorting domain-containing protein [Flavobacteriales bacterium]